MIPTTFTKPEAFTVPVGLPHWADMTQAERVAAWEAGQARKVRRTFFNFVPFTDAELEGMSREQLAIEVQFLRAAWTVAAMLERGAK